MPIRHTGEAMARPVGAPTMIATVLRALSDLRAIFAREVAVARTSSVEVAPAIAGTVARARRTLHTAVITEPA